MNRPAAKAVALFILWLSTAPATVQASGAAAEIAQRVEALARAFEIGDAEAVAGFVSPDMHLIHPTRGEATAADFLASVRAGVRPNPGRRLRVALDHVYTDGNLAVVNITWRTTLTARDGSVSRRGERDQEVWRREKGKWMLFRGASFPVPAEE